MSTFRKKPTQIKNDPNEQSVDFSYTGENLCEIFKSNLNNFSIENNYMVVYNINGVAYQVDIPNIKKVNSNKFIVPLIKQNSKNNSYYEYVLILNHWLMFYNFINKNKLNGHDKIKSL